MNFDTKPNGNPTASHKWEEQFRVPGQRSGLPPVEKLVERIRQLLNAIDTNENASLRKGWQREIEWRKRQLEDHRKLSE